MDLGKYKRAKERGLVQVHKVGAAFAVFTQRFDPETGEPTVPEVEAVDLVTVEQWEQQIEAQLAEVRAFKADLVALHKNKL